LRLCLQGFLGYATIPGGGELAYSEIGMISSKGHRFESEGVIPDIEVPLTREDLRLQPRSRAGKTAEVILRKNPKAPSTKTDRARR
jgi:C-terminal processing protease CtpA/Prc